MATLDFPYPSDLDSDGGGDSDGFEDYSDDGEDHGGGSLGNLANAMSFVSLTPTLVQRAFSSRLSGTPTKKSSVCVVCGKRPPYVNHKTGRSYPTCGLTCAAELEDGGSPSRDISTTTSRDSGLSTRNKPSLPDGRRGQATRCAICKTRSVIRSGYVTCGLKCAEKLCRRGGDPALCDYCHRNPRSPGSKQCGVPCSQKAKSACLLCKCRPKNGARYHLCGKTCKRIATKMTPLILEAPKGHKTYDMVEKKFRKAWRNVTVQLPTIKRIFKIIENDEFLRPYSDYKRLKGNECFRYHGTDRHCQLGVSTTQLCSSTSCSVCSILKTSFKISLAKSSGAFGAGVYTSSAPNKAYNYTGGNGKGALLLTKVVLGNVKVVQQFAEVSSCPPGYDSVVYDRYNGALNETIIYSDEAIRPVFLIMF